MKVARRKTNAGLHGIGVLALMFLASLRLSAVPIPHGTVDFVAEDQWIAPGHKSYVGLHFRLNPGWHIYWVNPGDSGQPPRAEWRLSKGLSAGEIEWPAPRRLGTPNIADFGYDEPVTLLVPIRAADSLRPNQAAQLGAELTVLICREICIPGKAHISLSLPIKLMPPEQDDRTRELFASARKSLPLPAPADWKVRAIEAGDSFILTVVPGRGVSRATFFPLEESQVDNSAAQKLVPSTSGFRLTLRKSDQLLKPITKLRGVLEVSANESYLIDAPVGGSGASKKVE